MIAHRPPLRPGGRDSGIRQSVVGQSLHACPREVGALAASLEGQRPQAAQPVDLGQRAELDLQIPISAKDLAVFELTAVRLIEFGERDRGLLPTAVSALELQRLGSRTLAGGARCSVMELTGARDSFKRSHAIFDRLAKPDAGMPLTSA